VIYGGEERDRRGAERLRRKALSWGADCSKYAGLRKVARGRWKCSGRVEATGGKCLNIRDEEAGGGFRAARTSFSSAIFGWEL
jgi:hypothetical protein